MKNSIDFNGFPIEGLGFLSNIIQNNSKEWLDGHRDEYEKYILSPNRAYVEEMGEHLDILVPGMNAIPKVGKSLFKIYRDARFHPHDPIKERIGVIFWQGAGHRMQSSSFYMHYDPYQVMLATGIRTFKPTLLRAYREYIQNDTLRSELHSILESLKTKGFEIPETKYKRMPRGCDIEDEHSYLYRMGQIYCFKYFKPDSIFHSSEVIYRNFEFYKDSLELHQWLYELTLKCDTDADAF